MPFGIISIRLNTIENRFAIGITARHGYGINLFWARFAFVTAVRTSAKTKDLEGAMDDGISQLLEECQQTSLKDRRASARKPFVRPVRISQVRNGEPLFGFSRDISQHGLSIVSQTEFKPGTQATLQIHRLSGNDTKVRSEARWCESYGQGWYVTGWHFLHSI